MAEKNNQGLSRRERQILEIVYKRGEAAVGDVMETMDGAPSYSAVRTIMNLMVDKGHLKYREEGKKYVYYPAVAREKAGRSALNNLLHTFYSGSVSQAVVSLVNMHKDKLSEEDLNRLARLIKQSKKKDAGNDSAA